MRGPSVIFSGILAEAGHWKPFYLISSSRSRDNRTDNSHHNSRRNRESPPLLCRALGQPAIPRHICPIRRNSPGAMLRAASPSRHNSPAAMQHPASPSRGAMRRGAARPSPGRPNSRDANKLEQRRFCLSPFECRLYWRCLPLETQMRLSGP